MIDITKLKPEDALTIPRDDLAEVSARLMGWELEPFNQYGIKWRMCEVRGSIHTDHNGFSPVSNLNNAVMVRDKCSQFEFWECLLSILSHMKPDSGLSIIATTFATSEQITRAAIMALLKEKLKDD